MPVMLLTNVLSDLIFKSEITVVINMTGMFIKANSNMLAVGKTIE